MNIQPAPFTAQLLTTLQASAYLGVSRWSVQRLVISGELPVIRSFKTWRIARHDLDAFIERERETLA